jgi:hypothetical protein
MDKVQKHNSFNTNTPSSESYRNYQTTARRWLNFVGSRRRKRRLHIYIFALSSVTRWFLTIAFRDDMITPVASLRKYESMFLSTSRSMLSISSKEMVFLYRCVAVMAFQTLDFKEDNCSTRNRLSRLNNNND